MYELKDYYFLIYLENINENDNNYYEIKFNTEANNPRCIFKKKIEEEKEQNIKLVQIFKYSIEKNTKTRDCSLDFSFSEKNYKIMFDTKEKTFIFKLRLIQDTTNLNQDKIGYVEKMNYYIEALKKTNEINKIETLYKDSINLYSKLQCFHLLINIFINIYNTSLCKILLDEYNKTRNNAKLFEQKLELQNSEQIHNHLNEIFKKKENIISSNSLNKIDFYGLILSIYNNLFYDNFEEKFIELYKNDKYTIIEVLLKYKKLFKNNIYLTKEILNEIIQYSADKSYEEFRDNGLFFLRHINLFLDVINNNKDKIIAIKDFIPIDIIEIEKSQEIDLKNIVKILDDILEFSEENKLLLINFGSVFWKTIVKKFSEENKENIELCYKFNLQFEKYETIENNLSNKNKLKNDSKEHIKVYLNSYLDKIINNYIKNNQKITNQEIIDLIYNYDIIYKDENYVDKRDPYILEKIQLDEMDDDFISKFQEMEFYKIFKDNEEYYIMILTNKIKTIADFDNILQLIKIDEIKDNKKKSNYLQVLRNKYDIIINQTDTSYLPNNKILIKSLTNLINFICFYENSLDFIKTMIKNSPKFNGITRHNIYIEIIKLKSEKKYIELHNFIKEEYLDLISKQNDLTYFIEFLENLNEDDLNNIFENLDDKYIIKEEDFYSNKEKQNIILLNSILKKQIKLSKKNKYIENNIEILKKIFKDIDEKEIKYKDLASINNDKKEIVLEKLKLFLLMDSDVIPGEIYKNLEKYHKILIKILNELDDYNSVLELFHNISKKEIILEIKKYRESLLTETYNNFYKKIPGIKRLLGGLKVLYDKIIIVKKSYIFKELIKIRKESNLSNEEDDSLFDMAFKDFEDFKKKINDNSSETDLSTNEIMKIIDKGNRDIINEYNSLLCENKEKSNEEQKIKSNLIQYKNDLTILFQFLSYFKKIESEVLKWKKKCRDLLDDNFYLQKVGNAEKILNELQEQNLYNYKEEQKNKSNYFKIFNLFIDKGRALSFLYNHNTDDIKHLYEKIGPNARTLEMNDISYTINCIGIFNDLKKIESLDLIMDYIKSKMDDTKVYEYFKKYSENFSEIINLYQNFDFSLSKECS